MEAAATAIGRAQALLDPTGQQLFSTARLMPYLNIAYSALRDEGVASREVTAAENVATITGFDAAAKHDLGDFVKPGAPLASMAAPLTIRERPAGSGDDDWSDLERVAELPARTPDDRLRSYEWRGGNVYFVGATQPLDLLVRFEQIWPVVTDVAQPLAAIGVANILGYWTAGLMATAMREQQLGAQYIGEAKHLLFRWVQRQVMDSQAVVRRPLPFRNYDCPYDGANWL